MVMRNKNYYINLNDREYEINRAAFDNIEAYRSI